MRAVLCKEVGGPLLLEEADVDEPEDEPGRLLIDVEACAVNFPDLLMLRGLYQYKPGTPFIPGSEVSGIVRRVGDGVTGFRPGDRVVGSTPSIGGLAEVASVQAEKAAALPDEVTFQDGAGLLYAYGTSHHALKDRAELQPGESLLVLGAAGGVGLAAVEIGKIMGARVIAAASTEEKLELCRAHGADETINYVDEDLKTRVRELTGGEGADVVYDPVGGTLSEAGVRATAWNGRFLVIGFAAGDIPRIPLNLLLLRGCSIVGVYWGAFAGRQPERNRANAAELMTWLGHGQLRPHTSASYPLERAADAFRDLAERRVLGKVVVTPSTR